jgi:hypothetical protein
VAWERAGRTISAPFAGVHIVEAMKQVYRAVPARREKRRLVPVLEPVLEPVLKPASLGAALFGTRCRLASLRIDLAASAAPARAG